MKSHMGFYCYINHDQTALRFNCPCCKTSTVYDFHKDSANALQNIARDTNYALNETTIRHIYDHNNRFYREPREDVVVPQYIGEPLEYTCPACKEVHVSYLYDPVNSVLAPFYTGMTMTEDYARIQMSIFGLVYTTYNKAVQTHPYMTRIVFNKRTGRVTMLKPLDKKNKPFKMFHDFNPFWNMTYGDTRRRDIMFINYNNPFLISDLKKHLLPRMTKALQERFPYIKDNHFDDCFVYETKRTRRAVAIAGNDIFGHVDIDIDKQPLSSSSGEDFSFSDTLSNIIKKFRFHDFELSFLESIKNAYGDKKISSLLSKVSYRSKQQVSDYYKLLPKSVTRKVRKMSLRSVEMVPIIRKLDFIKEPSNLIKLLSSIKVSLGVDYAVSISCFYDFYMPFLLDAYKDKIKDKKRLHQYCETLFVNRVIQATPYLLDDTVDMYRQIVRLNINENNAHSTIDVTLNVQELHDTLTDTYNAIRFKNQELTYTEEQLALEWSNGTYTFKLAPDTNYLRKTGRVMHICVGSYADRALRKGVYIVTVSSAENEHECCIELTHDLIAIVQAKIYRNGQPSGELLKALWDWATEKDLIVNTYDMYENHSVYGEKRPEIAEQIQQRRRTTLEQVPVFNNPEIGFPIAAEHVLLEA